MNLHKKHIWFLLNFFAVASFSQSPNITVLWPSYDAPYSIEVGWSMVPGASQYEIRSKENADAYSGWQDMMTSTSTTFFGLNVASFYTYQVRAMVGGSWGSPSAEKTTDFNKVWPVKASNICLATPSLDVLVGFNDPVMEAGIKYFHSGMDLQGPQNGHSECVVAPFGGMVVSTGCLPGNPCTPTVNLVVVIEVIIDGTNQLYEFNHLKNIPPSVVPGTTVKAGDKIGEIDNMYVWNKKTSHTHFGWHSNTTSPWWFVAKDPHEILQFNPSYSDPYGSAPVINDANDDGAHIRFRRGPESNTYLPDDSIVHGTVDIVAEIYDQQSADAPWVNPKSMGYYVQFFNGFGWANSIASAVTPLVLIDNAHGFIPHSHGQGGATTNEPLRDALVDFTTSLQVDTTHTPDWFGKGPMNTGTGWDKYCTYIVTNTTSTNGDFNMAFSHQAWVTDAMDTSTAINGTNNVPSSSKNPLQSKFKDGNYRVFITASDWNNASSDNKEIIVDNFRPIVKRVEVQQYHPVYEAEWESSENGTLSFQDNTLSGHVSCFDVPLIISVITSEKMKSVTINIPTIPYSSTVSSPSLLTNTVYEFTIPQSDLRAALDNDRIKHRIIISGLDEADNQIQGFTSKSDIAADGVPKRQDDGSWDPDLPPLNDTLHKFKLDSIIVMVEKTDVDCDNEESGQIEVTVTDNVPPYFYEWSIAGSDSTITDLGEGTYSVTVTDGNDCTITKEEEIESPRFLEVEIEGGGNRAICSGDPIVVGLKASLSEACPECEYLWLDNNTNPSKIVNHAGFYGVDVTDTFGCVYTADTYLNIESIDCDPFIDEEEDCHSSSYSAFVKGGSSSNTNCPGGANIQVVAPVDPNDISGPPGFGSERWISINATIPYLIRFENDPEQATATARIVEVVFPIEEHANMSSFRLGNYGFANQIFNIPPNSAFYSTRLDLVSTLGVFVDVTAGLDIINKQAFWLLEAVDPATGVAPTDPFLGLLPVNDSTGVGEGFMNFTIMPHPGSNTGDTLSAYADIIFDGNAPLRTPTVFNIIDALPPTTDIDTIIVVNDSTFDISWSGADDAGGSGLAHYDLFVSENGNPFLAEEIAVITTSTTFNANPVSTYNFFTRGTDNVTNLEDLKSGDVGVIPISCQTPTGLSATNLVSAASGSKAKLSWTPVAEAVNYTVNGGLLGSNPNTWVTLTIGATSFTATDLSETCYVWRVKTNCSGSDESAWSPIDTFCIPVCGTPVNLQTNVVGTTATFSWDQAAGAIGYIFQAQTSTGSYSSGFEQILSPGNLTSLTLNSIPPGSYKWHVRNGCNVSPLRLSPYSPDQLFTINSPTAKTSAEQDLYLFPNPARDVVDIILPGITNWKVQIYDIHGRLLYSNLLTDTDKLSVNTSDFASGSYEVVVVCDFGRFLRSLVISN